MVDMNEISRVYGYHFYVHDYTEGIGHVTGHDTGHNFGHKLLMSGHGFFTYLKAII
jgi:hypothetical protein